MISPPLFVDRFCLFNDLKMAGGELKDQKTDNALVSQAQTGTKVGIGLEFIGASLVRSESLSDYIYIFILQYRLYNKCLCLNASFIALDTY